MRITKYYLRKAVITDGLTQELPRYPPKGHRQARQACGSGQKFMLIHSANSRTQRPMSLRLTPWNFLSVPFSFFVFLAFFLAFFNFRASACCRFLFSMSLVSGCVRG